MNKKQVYIIEKDREKKLVDAVSEAIIAVVLANDSLTLKALIEKVYDEKIHTNDKEAMVLGAICHSSFEGMEGILQFAKGHKISFSEAIRRIKVK